MSTRAFGRNNDSGALIPLADLFNHNNVSTSYYFGDTSEFVPFTLNKERDSGDEDQDEELIDNSPCVVLSCQKLYQINISVYDLDENERIIARKVYEEAKSIDSRTLKGRADSPENPDVFEYVFKITMGENQLLHASDEVQISYGRYSNRQLLTYYGFALPSNKYNYATIKIPVKDLLISPQFEFLHKIYTAEIFVNYKFKLTQLNLLFLRHIRASLWDIRAHDFTSFFSPTDLQLEVSVLTRASELLSTVLSKYPTSLEQDRELLSTPSSLRHSFAVPLIQIQYRTGVKSTLQAQLHMYSQLRGILPTNSFYEEGKTPLSEYLVILRLFHPS